jgi:hypothetical protein
MILVELSLVVIGNDVLGCTPNVGKLILVVVAGGMDTTLSLVVVGTICVVIGVGTLGSLAITSGNLLDDTDSFPVVTGGSIAK